MLPACALCQDVCSWACFAPSKSAQPATEPAPHRCSCSDCQTGDRDRTPFKTYYKETK